MGGRGTSSKRRVSRAKTSSGNLKYKGKVETTDYKGFAYRYTSKYEEATGKSDTVAYKVGHAYYKLNSAVRKLITTFRQTLGWHISKITALKE